MDGKTHKANKRILKTLQKAGFRSPYQIVVEDTFLTAVSKSMLRLGHLTNLFRGQPKLFITRCTYRSRGKEKREERGVSKYLEIMGCSHEDGTSSFDCLRKIMKTSNRNHYILASNSDEMMEMGREKKVPVLTCKRGSLALSADVEGMCTRNAWPEAGEEELERLSQLFPEESPEQQAQ